MPPPLHLPCVARPSELVALRGADANLVAVQVEHRERAHAVVREDQRGEPGGPVCVRGPVLVDGVDVPGVDEAASGLSLPERRPDEVQLSALVLDDQVVPLLRRRPLAGESEGAIERLGRSKVAAGEQRKSAEHARDYRSPPGCDRSSHNPYCLRTRPARTVESTMTKPNATEAQEARRRHMLLLVESAQRAGRS